MLLSSCYQWPGIRKSLTTNRCNSRRPAGILLLLRRGGFHGNIPGNHSANTTCNGLNTWVLGNVPCILRLLYNSADHGETPVGLQARVNSNFMRVSALTAVLAWNGFDGSTVAQGQHPLRASWIPAGWDRDGTRFEQGNYAPGRGRCTSLPSSHVHGLRENSLYALEDRMIR